MSSRACVRALLLVATLAAPGCYRSASFEPREIQRWSLDGSSPSADIVTREGERLHIAHYDSVVIEERERAGLRRWWQREHEYDAPVLARLTANELEIQDAKRHALFVPANVERVTFYEYAPKRTAIVLGVSAVLATIVGVVLANELADPAAASETNQKDVPYIVGTGGALLTFGACLAIALPLSSSLGEEPEVGMPRASTAKRSAP